MATRSAAKAHRQSLKRRLRSRAARSATQTIIRRAIATIASGDLDAARQDVRAAISTLDRASGKGILHPNNAARRKSRLLLKYNAAVAALQAPVAEPQPGKSKPARPRASRASGSKKAKE